MSNHRHIFRFNVWSKKLPVLVRGSGRITTASKRTIAMFVVTTNSYIVNLGSILIIAIL